jgi:acetolactate synthase-1/2/3 large subunit
VFEADLVFFIGSHTGSQVTNNWRIPAIGTPVIQLISIRRSWAAIIPIP